MHFAHVSCEKIPLCARFLRAPQGSGRVLAWSLPPVGFEALPSLGVVESDRRIPGAPDSALNLSQARSAGSPSGASLRSARALAPRRQHGGSRPMQKTPRNVFSGSLSSDMKSSRSIRSPAARMASDPCTNATSPPPFQTRRRSHGPWLRRSADSGRRRSPPPACRRCLTTRIEGRSARAPALSASAYAPSGAGSVAHSATGSPCRSWA
jgi:hypothetical protein